VTSSVATIATGSAASCEVGIVSSRRLPMRSVSPAMNVFTSASESSAEPASVPGVA
jgi:hypothetical protein